MENDAENEWLYGGCYIRKDNEHGICVATIPPCQRHERGNAPVTPLERRIKAMNEKLKSMVDTIMEHLKEMTTEERLEWFANDPALHLRFMNEIDGTTYIVRCHFDEKAGESIFAKTQRLLLKRNDISRK